MKLIRSAKIMKVMRFHDKNTIDTNTSLKYYIFWLNHQKMISTQDDFFSTQRLRATASGFTIAKSFRPLQATVTK